MPLSRPGSLTARRTLRTVASVLVVQAILVFAFVFPGYKPEPHHVPVGVVAPPSIERAVAAKAGDDFSFTSYDSESAARAAIDEREIYGALVAGTDDSARLLVASAASMTVSQLLRAAFAHGPAAHVEVQDVKPLDANDPRGAAVNLAFLPLIGACLSAAFALGSLRLGRRSLLAAAASFSALGGLVVAAVLHFGLDAVPGSYAALSAVTALTILAVALPTAGLQRLLGNAGVALGALLFLVIGNPASGNGTAPELLPRVWRSLSQLMPPGAGGTSLRNVAYFGGNAVARPLLVLSVYAVAGAVLVLVAGATRRARVAPATLLPRRARAVRAGSAR